MTVKLATAGRICVITEKACPSPWLINYSHIVPGLWYPGTATKSCAASYRWFRDVFGGDYRELDRLASQVVPGCEGIMFHPYLNGELTPYADPLLSGSFIGIRANFGKGHFARAVLEGVALSMLDCLDCLERLDIEHDNHATIIGGGGASPLWRQILADTLQLELVQNERSDSSFGSAMLAGIAAGMFDSPEQAVGVCTRSISRTQPNADMSGFYRDMFAKYKAVHDALAPVYHQ
ncbi:MAG: FGGY-family carbohydrate kinase [Thermoguttaceae bacterium]|nr:FGGY-family carbohydrate kinase [Thermoguttaceae bacterium]